MSQLVRAYAAGEVVAIASFQEALATALSYVDTSMRGSHQVAGEEELYEALRQSVFELEAYGENFQPKQDIFIGEDRPLKAQVKLELINDNS